MRTYHELHELEAKYADGGKINLIAGALKAVREAITHLGNGDHESAIAALHTSPAAMAHPEIAAVVDQMAPSITPSAALPGAGQRPPLLQGDALQAHIDAIRNPPVRPPIQSSEMQPDALLRRQANAEGGSIDINKAIPSDIGSNTILHSLVGAMKDNPEASPVLRVHALALLRANLQAAHALHATTGDPTGYSHYIAGARLLSQALGGGNDSLTAQMIAHEMGGGGDAMAPAAIGAANQAVGPQQPAGPQPQPGGALQPGQG